jgi:hypothetical protein
MTKEEFEKLAIRNGAGNISAALYESIERYYMSDSDYHCLHGGEDETKSDFVKRVFGGKVNTPKTIIKKIADESVRENNWCLRGNPSAAKDRLDKMESALRRHFSVLASMSERLSRKD